MRPRGIQLPLTVFVCSSPSLALSPFLSAVSSSIYLCLCLPLSVSSYASLSHSPVLSLYMSFSHYNSLSASLFLFLLYMSCLTTTLALPPFLFPCVPGATGAFPSRHGQTKSVVDDFAVLVDNGAACKRARGAVCSRADHLTVNSNVLGDALWGKRSLGNVSRHRSHRSPCCRRAWKGREIYIYIYTETEWTARRTLILRHS